MLTYILIGLTASILIAMAVVIVVLVKILNDISPR